MSLLAGLSQQGDSIADAQPLDADLTALSGLSTTGLVARTGSGTAATRTITGTANQITVTNGDGVAGNPTLSLPQDIATTSSPRFASLNVGAGAGAYLDQGGSSSAYFTGGAFYVGYSSDYLFKPVAPQAQGILGESGQISFWSNIDLTIGTNFSPTKRMVIGTSGNVGIGTTTPSTILDILASSATNSSFGVRTLAGTSADDYAFNLRNRTDSQTFMYVRGDGNVGIGTNTPSTILDIIASSATNSSFGIRTLAGTSADDYAFNLRNRTDSQTFMYVRGDGNVGIGTDTPSAQLHVSGGNVRFSNYGAGTLVTDSSGNITASSDASLKTVTGPFARGLKAVLKLTPRTYRWNEKSGMDTEDENVGFIAQEVLESIPEAVGQYRTSEVEVGGKKTKKREKAELLTLSDRPLIAALVNAVKELKAENDALSARIAKLEGKK